MVTTVQNPNDPRYRADPGEGFDGVVRLSIGGFSGTGTLLYDGRAILTAAHLMADKTGPVSIRFETRNGVQTFSSSQYALINTYDARNIDNDLAIIWLPQAAPVLAERYELYREGDEVGKAFTLVGYGQSGTGNTGFQENTGGVRLTAQNRFDADATELKAVLGAQMGWEPSPGAQLMADFDNGLAAQDAFGLFMGRNDLGLGVNEGIIGPGDSGGPAFIQTDNVLKVAGIASYIINLSRAGGGPDIDNMLNSSFGEQAGWARVGQYQQFIDQALRASYLDAPRSRAEVKPEVQEGNFGTKLTYFLLEFTGVRSNPNQLLSVDFATRDGTARAGEDYIARSGTLILYPNESQAVIPVEIIGDANPEPNETFFLDVFNPVGGSFGEGIARLTAMRTILDDDGWAM